VEITLGEKNKTSINTGFCLNKLSLDGEPILDRGFQNWNDLVLNMIA